MSYALSTPKKNSYHTLFICLSFSNISFQAYLRVHSTTPFSKPTLIWWKKLISFHILLFFLLSFSPWFNIYAKLELILFMLLEAHPPHKLYYTTLLYNNYTIYSMQNHLNVLSLYSLHCLSQELFFNIYSVVSSAHEK